MCVDAIQQRAQTTVINRESLDDVLVWRAQEKVVGREEYTHKYVCPDAMLPTPEDGVVLLSFVPCLIEGILYSHNHKQ